jgi:hypothetical protein
MTIASSTGRIQYNGNGTTQAFTVPFYFLDNSHLQVVLTSVASVDTVQTITTNYTVSGSGNPAGGTVTMVVAPALGEKLTIIRSVPLTQSTDLVDNDPLPAEVLETALDKGIMIDQQVQEQLDRAIKVPVGAGSGTLPAPQANTLIGWNGTATGLINYNPASQVTESSNVNFLQTGAGAQSRTVQAKLRDRVSLADFGAVGDGSNDDRTAIVNALNTQKPLEWVGTSGKSFRITSPISHTPTADVIWYGQGATLTYAGSHAEYALRLNDATGVEFILNDLTIDGAKLVNKVLEVLNNTSLTTPSEFIATNLYVNRARRLNTFSGGEALRIRGAFNRVIFNGGGVKDCELPTGQGTPGSIGISGVSVDWYSTTSYVREVLVDGFRVEKVYSSDLSYNDDQDGFVYFAPTDGTRKVQSNFSCISSEFVNCYGRSIKTQCRDTVVQASSFVRSEGLTRGFGNNEIDAQNGNGNFRDNSFAYTNGQEPSACVNVSGSTGTPGIVVNGCSVVLDTSTTLSTFAQVFPSGGLFSRHSITNNKIFGKVKEFFSFNANSNKNYADVSDNYIAEIVNGVTSEKALVYVRASGGTSPYFANIIATGNFYDNTHAPALVRDSISGVSMNSSLSQWGNVGFTTNTVTFDPSTGGLKTNAVAQIDKIGPVDGYSYARVVDLTILGSSTTTVSLGNVQGALCIVQMKFNTNASLIFSSSGSVNTGISVGSQWGVGNTTDPGSGTFRVWSSAANTLTFRNTDASQRAGVLFILTPGN